MNKKFNIAQHDSEERSVTGFGGLHLVEVSGIGEKNKPYTGDVTLLNAAKTLKELGERLVELVTYLREHDGFTIAEAVNWVIEKLNHAWNIAQRGVIRPGGTQPTGAREIQKMVTASLKAGISKEALEEAILQARKAQAEEVTETEVA